MKPSTDFNLPHVSQQAYLDSFAAECARTNPETLAKWLNECPESDPAYPIILHALDAKADALATEVRAHMQQPPVFVEDDLSCFEPADQWDSWNWDRLREQRRIEWVADQHDPAEEGL